MLTRPANSTPLAAEARSHDEVGFNRALTLAERQLFARITRPELDKLPEEQQQLYEHWFWNYFMVPDTYGYSSRDVQFDHDTSVSSGRDYRIEKL